MVATARPVPAAPTYAERAAVALTAQLDYERAKGRLEELNALAEHLPAAMLAARRRRLLDALRDAGLNYTAAAAERHAAACDAQRASLATMSRR